MAYSCPECRKRFRSESALKMHNQSKHKNKPIVEMPPRRSRAFLWLPVLIVGLLVGGLAFGGIRVTFHVEHGSALAKAFAAR